ncbi:MAG: hypothetical protein ABSA92_05665 [Candidatus Bathyarchaeia archaeon]|jgi:hypothetical protein
MTTTSAPTNAIIAPTRIERTNSPGVDCVHDDYYCVFEDIVNDDFKHGVNDDSTTTT